MERQTYDSAVLLVHGIGEQKQGATLDEFGGALVGAARDWLGVDSVEDLALETDPRDGPPQRRAVRVTRSEGEPLRLLLAESHWAGEVHAPSWRTLMAWLATTVPFLVQRAVDAGMRRSSRGIDATPRLPMSIALLALRMVQNVFAVVLALAVVLGLFAVGLLAGAAPVRARLFGAAEANTGPSSIWARVRALLVGFVGDSYALLHKDGPRSAIVDRVSIDLSRLEATAGDAPVVIIAHSQGAEIVRRVLAERAPGAAPVAGVVTFGAGIAKLHAVDLLCDQAARSWRAFGLRWLSAVCVVLAAVVAGGWSSAPLPHFAVVAGLVTLAAFALTAARRELQQIVGVRFAPADLQVDERQVAHWTDLHASSDPVSEGDLPVAECTRGYSRTIVNRCSLVHDHVAYWRNAEGFMAAVALEVARVTDGHSNPTRPAALADAERARARAIAAIRPIRLGTSALVVGLWAGLQPSLLGGAAIAVAAAGLLVAISIALDARAGAQTRALRHAHRQANRRRPAAAR